jgi:hypothetical protein
MSKIMMFIKDVFDIITFVLKQLRKYFILVKFFLIVLEIKFYLKSVL